MNSKQLYFGLLGGIALLVIALIGGVYGANRLLEGASATLLNDKLNEAVLSGEQQQLLVAKNDIKKYQSLAVIAQSVVPQDKDQAQTVRQIVNIADQNGITLSSITFPNSTLGSITGGASGGAQLSQLKPVIGITGVYNFELTVASEPTKPIPYSQFINFLSALEHNRRTALVSGITLQPNDKDRSTLSFTLVLDEYIKP